MTADIDRILRIIREEFIYDSLPRKAEYKLLYLVHKRCRSKGLDITVPNFWYMFGVMSQSGAEWSTGATPAEPTLPSPEVEGVDDEEHTLRSVVREVLDEYYEVGLEEITDRTYQDAPYEVQHEWRKLDKMVRTLHEGDDHPDFFEVNPSREDFWEAVDRVYDTFPEREFPQHETDLLNWYSIMARLLNSPELDADSLMRCNLSFWRLFSLSVAEKHRHGVSKEKVADILGIESFEDARAESRAELKENESKTLADKFENNPATDVEMQAADALAASVLNIPLASSE